MQQTNRSIKKTKPAMRNQPYFPATEGKQLLFFTNIQTKIATYYTALDITPARQTKLTLVLTFLVWAWQIFVPAQRKVGPTATAWRDDLAYGTPDPAVDAAPPVAPTLAPPAGTPFFGMLTWLFEEIARWKKAEGWTDTIGKDLGVIGAAGQAHTDPPVLSLGRVALNLIELLFNLYEHDGIWIESMVQGENAFTYLATDTGSPYLDARPVTSSGQAEWRDYRACWWDNDTASKQFGPVLRVLVQG